MRVVVAALAIAFCVGQLGCVARRDPAGASAGFGFAGAGDISGVSPTGPRAGFGPSLPMTMPPDINTGPAPIDVGQCKVSAAMNARPFATGQCIDCLCGLDPQATAFCDHQCWTLLFCAAASGCAASDTTCITAHCGGSDAGTGDVLDSVRNAQLVPFATCARSCTGEGVDEDAGSEDLLGGACASLRAEPAEATVGESVDLLWEPRVQAGEYTLSVSPWASVGSLELDGGQQKFRCDAEGTATITWDSDRCANAPLSLVVRCLPRSGQSCCPIDPIGESSSSSCAELGGSPPCFRGCGCLRNGGVYYTELDAQGCLQWVLRPARDSAEHLVCLDENGEPKPDPRNTP